MFAQANRACEAFRQQVRYAKAVFVSGPAWSIFWLSGSLGAADSGQATVQGSTHGLPPARDAPFLGALGSGRPSDSTGRLHTARGAQRLIGPRRDS
jgi:hypothetical protein